ncbi:MAG: YCF48-related protein [Planctomycetota bacterium]
MSPHFSLMWVCFAILGPQAAAQAWVGQAPDLTSVELSGVCTVSVTEAWAIGEAGVLVHTIDGGRTWDRVVLRDAMSDVTFVDPLHGWAVGNDVIRTTDGGVNWQFVDFTHGTLGAVFFLDQRQGWVGDYAGLFRTTDGGMTWEHFSLSSGHGPRTPPRRGFLQ